MLGRLFSAAASSLKPASYGKGSYNIAESTVDEQHTADLLFPPRQPQLSPFQEQSPTRTATAQSLRMSGFDDRGGLELDETKDLRIIIAQDAVAGQDRPCILFDSRPREPGADRSSTSYPPSETWRGHARAPSSAFSRNLPTSPLAKKQSSSFPMPGSANQARNRSNTISDSASAAATAAAAASNREADIQPALHSFMECMFGVSSSAKSGSSTKMHVIKPEFPTEQQILSRHTGKANSPVRPRQPISRSQTMTELSIAGASVGQGNTFAHNVILITRTFNVDLAETGDIALGSRATQPQSPAKEQSESPNPEILVQKRPKLRETKTPAFAVGLLVTLPRVVENRPLSWGHSRVSSAASRYGSVGSDISSTWEFFDYLPFSLASKPPSERISPCIDALVEEWDVVIRALSILEHEASKKIFELLRQAEESAKVPQVKIPKEKTMQRTNQRVVHLSSYALNGTQKLRDLAFRAIVRVALAIRIPRVVTGLGLLPGGHWLEEARTVARFCHNEQQGNFLHSLLTAFLGDHMDWIRFLTLHEADSDCDQPLENSSKQPLARRTVILCNQRALARRMVFLLASFFPGSGRSLDMLSVRENGYPQLGDSISHSSSHIPFTRSESLRRTLNKKQRDFFATVEPDGTRSRSLSRSPNESRTGLKSQNGAGIERPPLKRNDSGTSSIHIVGSLPIPTNDLRLRKSTATTTSVATPDPATPVPYFVSGSHSRDSYFPPMSPLDGTGSAATADLARILRRNSSSFGGGAGSTKWGSLLSSFWNGQADSSSTGNFTIPSFTPDKLRKPQHEATTARKLTSSGSTGDSAVSDVQSPNGPFGDNQTQEEVNIAGARKISVAPSLNVDKTDGVVDVDLNIPGFLSSSANTDTQSPLIEQRSPSHHTINSVHSTSSNMLRQKRSDSRHKIRVAGFLKHYHEDFALQAVKPYDTLIDDIKQSMSCEKTPEQALSRTADLHSRDHGNRWIDICSTLIADVQSLSVQRLTLKRKISGVRPEKRPSNAEVNAPSDQQAGVPAPPVSRHNSLLAEPPEEMFCMDTVVEFDSILAEAIDQALNEVSTQHSRTGSPAKTHSRTVSSSTIGSTTNATPPTLSSSLQPPQYHESVYSRRDSRRVVMGALEEVVKSVSNDLHRHENGRDIPSRGNSSDGGGGSHNGNNKSSWSKTQVKEENALREGVKRWLLSVQEREVW